MNSDRKLQLSLALATAATAGLSLPATASVINFVPQQNGEINVGLGCITTCIDPGSIFSSITSVEDSTTGTKSRLFVDYFGPGDTKQTYGSGPGRVVFQTRDLGTTPADFWFRPSEVGPDGIGEEKGQLEVGTYLFSFSKMLEELTIDFFDTETDGTTGVLAINGSPVMSPQYVPAGEDSNIVSQKFFNVSSILVKFGMDRPNDSGDGVDFKLSGIPAADVPEPASLLGLLAVAGLGLGCSAKRRNA